MKKYAKLLVLPVAFLAMASFKAADYTIDNDTVNVTLDATKAVGDSLKATVGTFDTGTFEASESTTEYATCKVTAVTTAYVAPVAQPVVPIQPITLGASSVMCVCPSCHATITTTIIYEAGGLCWLLCIGLFIFGFCLGCCLIPFCINDCKDVVHKCPNCNAMIGKYSRL